MLQKPFALPYRKLAFCILRVLCGQNCKESNDDDLPLLQIILRVIPKELLSPFKEIPKSASHHEKFAFPSDRHVCQTCYRA